MIRKLLALVACAMFATFSPAQVASGGMVNLPALKPVLACASLATADVDKAVGAHTIITSAAEMAGAKPYCKVTGTIAPQIKFEVRLPTRGWTQRYLQTGCGGLCGSLRINAEKAADCAPVTNGEIVLASTDMGHQGNGMEWGSNTQQREDFAHRGVHVTALAAKALIVKFYGKAPRYSYFAGCSDGGREALMEAQRHPGDFDGISAGAPALHFSLQNSMHHAWMAASNTGVDGKPILNASDLVPLHFAAMRACDAIDGLKDGQITDPRLCKFNPADVLCQGPAEPGKCLSAVQVEAARKLYDGARDAAGKRIVVGAMQPGGELEWAGVFVPRQAGESIFSEKIALDSINGLMFTPNPATPLKIADWKFDAATLASLEPARKFYDADDPNLSHFAKHGGKLILWHGWSDPHISPLNTIEYFDQVGAAMGVAKRDASLRMFLFPGMGHCSGGDGPNSFPLLSALMAWVEGGKAPTVMLASRAIQTMDGIPGGGPPPGAGGPPPGMMGPPPGAAKQPPLPPRSRPVYAYPAVAEYLGSGSIDDVSNFKLSTPTERTVR